MRLATVARVALLLVVTVAGRVTAECPATTFDILAPAVRAREGKQLRLFNVHTWRVFLKGESCAHFARYAAVCVRVDVKPRQL
jgi:hypothetical protein